jgi:hypothetical protein
LVLNGLEIDIQRVGLLVQKPDGFLNLCLLALGDLQILLQWDRRALHDVQLSRQVRSLAAEIGGADELIDRGLALGGIGGFLGLLGLIKLGGSLLVEHALLFLVFGYRRIEARDGGGDLGKAGDRFDTQTHPVGLVVGTLGIGDELGDSILRGTRIELLVIGSRGVQCVDFAQQLTYLVAKAVVIELLLANGDDNGASRIGVDGGQGRTNIGLGFGGEVFRAAGRASRTAMASDTSRWADLSDELEEKSQPAVARARNTKAAVKMAGKVVGIGRRAIFGRGGLDI